jgi:hypothetical protein
LPEPYDEHSLQKKEAAKRALFDLLSPATPFESIPRPVVGIVSRLVDHWHRFCRRTEVSPSSGPEILDTKSC